jgi:sporulation protein YlmC with PRC-barrel domain
MRRLALTTLMIGSDAVCRGGYRGEVQGVVIDPATSTVRHIVVEPKGRVWLARLVPLGVVDVTPGEVRLDCTEAEFKILDPAEETVGEFMLGYSTPVQLVPPGWRGEGGPAVEGSTIPRIPEQKTVNILPPGEVEERRGDHVFATDGDIGEVGGLRIDPGSGQVTHVVLKAGPRWARKEVAIPYGKVAEVGDGIRLSITKQQVRDLPPADTDLPLTCATAIPCTARWRVISSSLHSRC